MPKAILIQKFVPSCRASYWVLSVEQKPDVEISTNDRRLRHEASDADNLRTLVKLACSQWYPKNPNLFRNVKIGQLPPIERSGRFDFAYCAVGF